MKFLALLILLLIPSSLLAAPPPANQPVHRNMPDVENARDRGAGRIVDPQTYELDRLDDNRRDFEQLLGGRDRQLRIEQQQLREQGGTGAVKSVPATAAAPATEPSIVNDVYMSDLGEFVARTDRQLTLAREARDRAMRVVVETFDAALRNAARETDVKKSEAMRVAAERQYTDEKARVTSNFYNQKMRILGWPTTEPVPATMPTTRP